jgi:hypothetical protein
MNNLRDMMSGPTGNRVFGLARAAFYGLVTYEITRKTGLDYKATPFIALGSLLTLDGLADLVLGELYSIPTKVGKYLEGEQNAN